MHLAALQTGMPAAAHGDARLSRGDHLALLEHPAPAVHHGDAGARRVVDRAPAHRGPGGAAHLDAYRGPADHADVPQLGRALLHQHG